MTTETQTAYCHVCESEQPIEIIDSEPDSCGAFINLDTLRQYRTGVHMRGYRCLTCGDADAEPCIHD